MMISKEIRKELLNAKTYNDFNTIWCGNIVKGTKMDEEIKKHLDKLWQEEKVHIRKRVLETQMGYADGVFYDNFKVKRQMEEKRRQEEQQNKE